MLLSKLITATFSLEQLSFSVLLEGIMAKHQTFFYFTYKKIKNVITY